MKAKRTKIFALLVLFAFYVAIFTGGEKAMADTVLFRVSLANNQKRVVVVKKSGENLTFSLEGFATKPIALKANGGGTSTCRTIIEHNSDEANVVLSLAIPDTQAKCRMLPSFVSIESRPNNISIDEETVKKIAGSNANLRSTVKKLLGTLDAGEG
jgi:hypothetical protein